MNPVYVTCSFASISEEMVKRGSTEEEVREALSALGLIETSEGYCLKESPTEMVQEKSPELHKHIVRYLARGNSADQIYHSIMLECQKTKTFQMIKEICRILGFNPFTGAAIPGAAVDASQKALFLVSQNMQDLTAQNCERIVAELGDKLQLFVFTSQREKSTSNVFYNPSLEDAQTYVREYHSKRASPEPLKIPFFIFLANTQQITKMSAILATIQGLGITEESNQIGSYLFFDEADQTYPISREILMNHIFDSKIYRDFGVIRPPSEGCVRKIYWISATQEEMVLEYPECAVSKQALIEFQDGVMENHYSILDSSAVMHCDKIHQKAENHNAFLIQTIGENQDHFFGTCPDGSYRKIIGLSSMDNMSQLEIVQQINRLGGNVILLNQEGVFLYKRIVITTDVAVVEEAPQQQPAEELPESTMTEEAAPAPAADTAEVQQEEEEEFESQSLISEPIPSPSESGKAKELPEHLREVRIRGIELKDRAIKSRNALIAKAYHVLHPDLKDAPLFILGNKKVDRGLTFHYAPISSDAYSFILTDLIMGRIPNWRRAVQAFGRGNGVIKHRADFVGEIHYWVDRATCNTVIRHCKMMSDPMIIAALTPESPDYNAAELIEILMEKYPDLNEEAEKKGGSRVRMVTQIEFTNSFATYEEVRSEISTRFPDDKIIKRFKEIRLEAPTPGKRGSKKSAASIPTLYVPTCLKRHFNVEGKDGLGAEHICTESMLETIEWKEMFGSSKMDHLIIPYYQATGTVQWIGVIRTRIPGTRSASPSSSPCASASSSEVSNESAGAGKDEDDDGANLPEIDIENLHLKIDAV
jgi:hypothetical protein